MHDFYENTQNETISLEMIHARIIYSEIVSVWGSFTLKLIKQQSSAIAKHYNNMHGTMPQGLLEPFKVLKKCKNKFDCLVYEMLFIRSCKPNLNVQADSIRAKVFL